jgi:hypothetical protein
MNEILGALLLGGAPLLAVFSQGAGASATMPPQLSRHHGHFAVLLARGPYDDLHVLPERGEEVHEAFDGKGAGAVAHQCRNVRLLDAENLSGFPLLEAVRLIKGDPPRPLRSPRKAKSVDPRFPIWNRGS